MLTIYFFYGLAFIILSAVIFLLPRREDCLGLDKSMIFIGWFGLLHGLNEWVDLLVLAGEPFNAGVLSKISSALLPLSFTFLIIFGCLTISRMKSGFRWLNAAWVFFPLLWAGISIVIGDSLVSGISARYILCVPGTILTSLAIYLSLRRCDAYAMPKPVITGAWVSIAFFLLYGVFSGMVTPKASFFPASLINYPNFLNTFHLPVQLLRMVCAFTLSLGFILLIGTFSGQRPGQTVKGTIKGKLTLMIAASVIVVTIVGTILTYFTSSAVLMNTLGKEYSQIANTLSVYTIGAIKDEIEDAMSYATRPLWKDAITVSNSRYEGMNAGSIKLKLLDMDKRWIAAKPGDPILKEYLESRVSIGMSETLKARTKISEIFITDKYGGLVAASDKTSDFYQADEEWWQRAYNDGKGDIYVSDIEFDESSKNWVISIAVPIKDLISNEVIGICKDSAGIEKLFGNLANFKLGNTGHAALIDDKGTAIFHSGISAMTKDLFPEKIVHKMLAAKNSYLAMKSSLLHDRNTFVAFNEVKPPHSSDINMSWIVLVVQDTSEVFAPIRNFIIQISMIAILMMALIIPVGSFFSKFIADPIHELHLATEKVMAGDWDYKIDVKTGDEIEQFADTFRNMIADIKSKQKALQSFSNGLEAKVEERTKELNIAQEATLNILEDLQASKEALERTNKELMKLDELKSDFISTVSHELRTPLSIIKEGISLVLDKIPGEINEKQAKILDISKYNIDRLARIIDSLLDISKIEAGKVELKRSLIDISEVVRRVANSFELKIKEKGLKMRLDVDKVSGSVWADADRITQVLTNLIGNAVKFTPSGSINISCKDKGDAVVCSVSDTGVGISKEDMPKVFDKFQQFGRIAGAGDKGTGLGLSIVKDIIEMHNGDVWVESEFTKGSRFTFKLHKYTPESLFREYVSSAVKISADKGAEMSIIAVNSSLTGKDSSGMINKKFNDIMHESARLIKNTLRREGDYVVSNIGEMIVILADCDKESAARVQYRLEGVVSKYLADQNAAGAIKVNYGCATYPDDAKDDLGLIEKARSALAASAKA
jgi:signal transduction histidine kinase